MEYFLKKLAILYHLPGPLRTGSLTYQSPNPPIRNIRTSGHLAAPLNIEVRVGGIAGVAA